MQGSFFMPKFRYKGGRPMLSDEVLERIFAHKDMRLVPIGYQSTVVTVIGEVLDEIEGERPNATISELLSSTDDYISKQLSAGK